MIRKAFPHIAVLLLIGLTWCKNSAADNAAKIGAILKPFAGEWVVVSLDRGGKRSSAQEMQDIRVTVEGDRFTIVELRGSRAFAGGRSVRDVFTEDYTLQVDPAQPLGEINFAYLSPSDLLGQTRPGLYAFEENQLKICLAESGGSRPTDFTAGNKVQVLVLESKK